MNSMRRPMFLIACLCFAQLAAADGPIQLRDADRQRLKDGTDFTPNELRKVYCWGAKRKGWKSLPDGIEQMLTD
jgi:hypothetical protein